MSTDFNLLDTTTLRHSSHGECKAGEYCAREILHLAVTGIPDDETPDGLTPHLAILSGLNDAPWRDDAHRTEVLRPFLRRLAVRHADPERDRRISYALADYAIRVCAAEALEEAGKASAAKTLRTLAPIVDQASGDAAARAAARASYAAAYASSNAPYAASYAASYAAEAASYAAEAASYAARAATAADAAADLGERHTRALLTIVVETP